MSQRADTALGHRRAAEMATCLEPGRAAWRGPVNARGALRGDSTGRPRRAPRPAGTPGTSGERSRSRGARLVNRARADEDGRDAAAAAARLAPLEASTAAGSELERILKTDPVAFERALSDQVGAPPSPAAPSLLPQSLLSEFTLFYFLADPPRILASRRPPVRAVGCAHAAGTRRGGWRVRVTRRVERSRGRRAPRRVTARAFPTGIPSRRKSATTTFFLAFPHGQTTRRVTNVSPKRLPNLSPHPSCSLVRSFARWRPTCSTRRSPADARGPSASGSPAARSGHSCRRPPPLRGTAAT